MIRFVQASAALAQCCDLDDGDRGRAGRDHRCRLYQPDLLPDGLRPKPRTQVAEVKAPAAPAAPSAQYVAVLQKEGGAPAFILTVDGATKNFTIRKVGAAAEPGKSYEFWLISDRLPKPRSLGVIGVSDFNMVRCWRPTTPASSTPRPMR